MLQLQRRCDAVNIWDFARDHDEHRACSGWHFGRVGWESVVASLFCRYCRRCCMNGRVKGVISLFILRRQCTVKRNATQHSAFVLLFVPSSVSFFLCVTESRPSEQGEVTEVLGATPA